MCNNYRLHVPANQLAAPFRDAGRALVFPGGLPNLAAADYRIGDVTISVSLDATAHRMSKGKDMVGGVSFLFSKAAETSGTARADRCKVASVLTMLFAQEHLAYLGQADPAICFSFDVMAGKAYPAPKTYKTLLANMEAACEEVALRWAVTPAPDDYDGPPWS